MNQFLSWLVDKNFVSVRSGMLYVAIYMTMHATQWAEVYAGAHAEKAGSELGLVIAAVCGPITLFTGFVYKFYSDARERAKAGQ